MRGAAPMKVGLTTPVFSTILSTRPSIALAKPHASWVEISTLPKACASGSQSSCTSSSLSRPMLSITAPSYTQALCRSRTPFGLPVVPEV